MVDPNHTRLSIARQCRLVSIARSSFYYEGTGETPLTQRWTPKFGQVVKVGSRPRRRSLACHGRDGVIRLS